MPVPRLLALVMLVVLCTGLAMGQSQQNDASTLVVFQGVASMDVVGAAQQPSARHNCRREANCGRQRAAH